MLTFQDIANAISIVYVVGFLIALGLALYFIKPAWGKALGALVVTGGFAYPILATVIPEQRAMKEHIAFSNEAWNYFRKKCDDESGVKIHKTFSGIKSVLIVKPLPPAGPADVNDQFWYGDPYSSTSYGEDRGINEARKFIVYLRDDPKPNTVGFEFVELRDERNGVIRFLKISPSRDGPYLRKLEDIDRPVSGFGISWQDISKPEDRKYWVAGSRFQVIDLSNNTVVAERVGFLIEKGFGSRAGARSPWKATRAFYEKNTSCPQAGDEEDQKLVFTVLQAQRGNQNGK